MKLIIITDEQRFADSPGSKQYCTITPTVLASVYARTT